MKRREFITLLGGAAAWPFVAHGQQAAMPVVGFLRNTPSAPFAHLVVAFRRGLKEAGFVEGQNIAIEQRWTEGEDDRLPALAADLIGRKVLGRRTFMQALGGAAAWPLRLSAQPASKPPTVGFLATGSGAAWSEWVGAFVRRLRELGWIEGTTIAIEVRWASGETERITEIAAEFVRRKVDAIVTSGLAIPMAQQATSNIPIIFAIANDPLSTGLVANLAKPGGNVTGLSLQSPDVAPKRVEILREIMPGLRRLAILTNARYLASVLEMETVQAIARGLGLAVTTLQVERAAELGSAFEALQRVGSGGATADHADASSRLGPCWYYRGRSRHVARSTIHGVAEPA